MIHAITIGAVPELKAVPDIGHAIRKYSVIPISDDAALLVSPSTWRATDSPYNHIASMLCGFRIYGYAVLCGLTGTPEDYDFIDVPPRFYKLLKCNETEGNNANQ